MLKFCVLASGSRGNCLYVESPGTRLLVDVGLSASQIERRLRSIQVDPYSLQAIVLTHHHNDHVRGVGVFARRFGLPVHGHPETLQAIRPHMKEGQPLEPWRQAFTIGDLSFQPFELSHDCFPTFGYLIRWRSRTLALCTDLGVVTDSVRQHLSQAHALVLESNHDPEMLYNGPYPWHLKERIAGRLGHLSNLDAGRLLGSIAHGGLQRVVLGHLSEKNNTARLALETVCEQITPALHPVVSVVEQRQVSEVFSV
ncbi:MAG: MBL fold metallo-hydrolase [Calditrichaeota bacterium]|nr:MAG: MBL fold metallo-hydrolase [Calditrichota bacterium]